MPDHVPVERPITVTASASDADNDPLTYSWTATSGSFDDAHAPATTFRCATRGAIVLTLTVSDASCDSTIAGQVFCQSADAGEEDGSAAGGRGGGGGTGTGGQAGTGGQVGTGGSTGAAGRGGAGGTAGSGAGGTTGAGGAAGGGTGGTSGGGIGGGGMCIETSPAPDIAVACGACIDANDNPASDGCCGLTDAIGKQLCQTASACMRTGNCNVGGDTITCFCGTNTMSACEATPNGPCVAQLTAAAGRNIVTMTTDAPTAMQVLSRFGDPAYAVGRAVNIHAIAGPFCGLECGIGQ